MLVSVVIPTLNEAHRIAETIASVQRQAGPWEIIIADGISTDATRELAEPLAKVLAAPRGRARQMNAGAAAASGDVLLFLHADTLLPDGALDAVRLALANPAVEAGAFRLRFDVDAPLLRFYSWCTRFSAPRLCFGDRALFVRRSAFESVGGFPDLPMFEDLELARLLWERGTFQFLPLSVTTAARRFSNNGALRQQLRNTYLWTHYLLGTDPHRLVHLYRYDGERA